MCRKTGRTSVLRRALDLVGMKGHTINVLENTEITEEKIKTISSHHRGSPTNIGAGMCCDKTMVCQKTVQWQP